MVGMLARPLVNGRLRWSSGVAGLRDVAGLIRERHVGSAGCAGLTVGRMPSAVLCSSLRCLSRVLESGLHPFRTFSLFLQSASLAFVGPSISPALLGRRYQTEFPLFVTSRRVGDESQ
jgi:hypothetical protein